MASPYAACRFATCKFPILEKKNSLILPNPGDAPERTPLQHRCIDDDGGNDEDLLLLAQLHGRLSPNPLPTRDQRQNNRDGHGSSREFGRRNDHISNLNVRDNHQETRDSSRARENERFRLRHVPNT